MNKLIMDIAVMNRSLQRWMDKPGWQLCLWLWGLLGVIGMIAYGGMLRPEWAERGRLIDELIRQQQNINNQQFVLVQLPSISSINEEINLLLQKELFSKTWSSGEAENQQFDSSLAHQVGEWIIPFGGQVVRWLRVFEPKERDTADAGGSQSLPGQKRDLSGHEKQWNTTLRVNFYGALHLLHQLSASPSPVLIKIIEINRENHALTIKLNLKEYLFEGKNE